MDGFHRDEVEEEMIGDIIREASDPDVSGFLLESGDGLEVEVDVSGDGVDVEVDGADDGLEAETSAEVYIT